MQNFEKFYSKFSEFLKDLNQKNSIQKERILKILYMSNKHLSAVEIQEIFCKDFKENISLTSIYQLLGFLEEINLANKFEHKDGGKFELNIKSHHDHLVCIKCGKIVGFCDEIIEKRQDEICLSKNFNIQGHTMIIYGVCLECQI